MSKNSRFFSLIVILLVCIVAGLQGSGIIPAIIPAAVPTANKQGNGNKFFLWAGAATPGDCAQLDTNGNASDAGFPCGSGSGGTGGITVYASPALTLLGGPFYFPIGGGSLNSTTEAVAQTAAPTALTFANFYVQISAPLGSGNSIVFTWDKNTTPQTLTCTISGTSATSCNDTSHSFNVIAGDLVDISATVTGTPVAFAIIMSATAGGITPATPSFSTITSGTNTAAAMTIGSGASMLTAGTGLTDFSAGGSTVPARAHSGAPTGSNCLKVGEQYFQTNAIAGQNLWLATTFGTPCTWTQVTGGGGGGSTITVGAIASLPVSVPASGNQYICTDSPYTFVSNGSAWLPFVFGYQVVQPILANFTQVNVDHSTIDSTHGGIIQSVTNQGGASDVQILSQNIPASGAYYVDAAFILLSGPASPPTMNFGLGSGLSEGTATSNALVFNHWGAESNQQWFWERQALTSTTAFNGNAGGTYLTPVGPLIWTRVYDDRTTNRTFFMSTNGYDWIQLYQEARTTLFTPNQGILAITPFSNAVTVHWVHFSIHT